MRATTLAIVVHHRGLDATARCVADLRDSRPAPDVLVVDSGSSDDVRGRLARPDVETLRLRQNRGYGAALNRGLARARECGYPFVWLLNNDLEIPGDAHARLCERARASAEHAIWTPALQSPAGDVQHVGGDWAVDGSRARLLTAAAFAGASPSGRWLTGTALFCRRDTVEAIGVFDERYFAYWEDVDWCFRATQRGVRLEVAAETAVTHVGGLSSGGRGSQLSSFLLARNELLLARTHIVAEHQTAAFRRIAARQIRWATLLDRRGDLDAARAVIGGMLAGLAGRHGRPRGMALPAAAAQMLLREGLGVARDLDRAAAVEAASPQEHRSEQQDRHRREDAACDTP